MNKGDIVLIPFPFTDLTGNKLRPVVILIVSKKDVTVSFITTQIKWIEKSDIYIEPSMINGLKKPSIIRLGKIATIDFSLVVGVIGNLNTKELTDLNKKLIDIFQLY